MKILLTTIIKKRIQESFLNNKDVIQFDQAKKHSMKISINSFVDIDKDLVLINDKRVLNKEILNFESNSSIYHSKSISKTTTFMANLSLSMFKMKA